MYLVPFVLFIFSIADLVLGFLECFLYLITYTPIAKQQIGKQTLALALALAQIVVTHSVIQKAN
jgi:hypothetical protein